MSTCIIHLGNCDTYSHAETDTFIEALTMFQSDIGQEIISNIHAEKRLHQVLSRVGKRVEYYQDRH